MDWDKRAIICNREQDVNITDLWQRELEYHAIDRWLSKDMDVLEVGCGNGYSTAHFRSHVKHIDAFDSSSDMILRARRVFNQDNNRFFVDDILNPYSIKKKYDAVLCVRVLINLENIVQQRKAIENMKRYIKVGGELILVEGFRDGYINLDHVRHDVGLPPLKPAESCVYSHIRELLSTISEGLELLCRFHFGMYDYLTRVVYPVFVGTGNVKHNTAFSEGSYRIAKEHNPSSFERLSRVRGFVLRKGK